MSKTSARIVSINNQITRLSNNLRDSLMDMEVNGKKFRLLKNPLYLDYFETARQAYRRDLDQIIGLNSDIYQLSELWMQIEQTYEKYTSAHAGDNFFMPLQGEPEDLVVQWMSTIAAAQKSNDTRIEQALIRINNQSREIVRNGVIGFGISIVVGVFGILFITRSMLTPLNKLETGLTQISNDNYTHEITIASNDEFGQLAATFNDMSRQLKADEEIRSDFIATLSHEIRTPLSSIQESVNMIIEEILGPVNEKQKKFLKLANSEITRITSLLNHLLDTSMLESGVEKPDPTPLEPNGLIREAVRRLDTPAKIKHATLNTHPLLDAPRVLGEKKEIMQVLMNIIGNAIKFSDENGQVDIRISTPRDDGFLNFHISDTGPGIPKEKHSLIFKKYYRAKEVRKHMSGVGLGLNISKRIVQAHGGQISVENNTDKGCTFSFTLPVQKQFVV
ncbi:MAG: HAMP domain-containing histidine kinase [Desulfobacteraceae bacterium]|nr:HAMP domain-containing histidine kinase [Desulfobacteraceae bacterium]